MHPNVRIEEIKELTRFYWVKSGSVRGTGAWFCPECDSFSRKLKALRHKKTCTIKKRSSKAMEAELVLKEAGV